MLPKIILHSLVIALLLVTTSNSNCAAKLTPAQQREVDRIKLAIRRAGSLFKQKRFEECGKMVTNAQTRIENLVSMGSDELLERLEIDYKRLSKAHALLALEGVKLPSLKAFDEMRTPPAPAPPKGKPSPTNTTPPEPNKGIVFSSHVAPILVSRCGRCHVNNARGKFSMASYDALMQGPPAGKVVFPKNVPGSRLVEVIEGKEMPPSGAGIPTPELATIKKWIAEGAQFDGNDSTASIRSMVSNIRPQQTTVKVAQATGKETVSFAADIAPVLNDKCLRCHGGGRQVRGQFNLSSFSRLLRGGDSGEAILPGNGAGSLLVRKLRGTADGLQMPQFADPLPDEVIAKFETWINEGATFDAPDPDQPITEVAALAMASASSHDELSARRAEIAEQNWRLGMPGITAQTASTKSFLLYGNVTESQLVDIGQQAEAMGPRLADILDAPLDQPLLKGRMTLYIFPQRYDYSEFGRMVEERSVPSAWRGHWRYSVVDAYAALIVPRRDKYSLEALIAQQIAGTYVASLGTVPSWFSEGVARVVASRVSPKDSRVVQWKSGIAEIIGSLDKPDDFQTGKLSPESAYVVSYYFAKILMKDKNKFRQLLLAIKAGSDFTQSFQDVYDVTPSQAAEAWGRR